MTTNKCRITAYVDNPLSEYLESFARSEGLSVSQAVEKILIAFFDQPTHKEKLDHQTIQKAIALLSSLVSDTPVSHPESDTPVSHPESDTPNRKSKPLEDHPDTVLQYLYGVVLVEDKKIKGFWDGRKYHDDPNRLKIYKAPPQTRVMSKAEIEASFRGQARWNDLFKILELLGYPHGFDKWRTVNLEKKWVNSNLDS
ncbi:Ribbon-helix-helix protein CopG domain-containing protein [Microcystis aeruginosa]